MLQTQHSLARKLSLSLFSLVLWVDVLSVDVLQYLLSLTELVAVGWGLSSLVFYNLFLFTNTVPGLRAPVSPLST